MRTIQKRHDAGAPASIGGQFAKCEYAEGGISLDGNDRDEPVEYLNENGTINIRTFLLDGKIHDGPNGEPGDQEFYPDGRQKWEHRYQHGVITDGPDGEPARQHWHRNGQLAEVMRCDPDGRPHNGSNSEPAIQRWHDNGQKSHEERMDEDGWHVPHDGPVGEPAIMGWHENGKIAMVMHAHHGIARPGCNGEPAVAYFDEDGMPLPEVFSFQPPIGRS